MIKRAIILYTVVVNPKEQIKENLSIVDVISSYIKVEKSGSQYKARCPFHNERTPSFYISPERKSYHCFGCSAHGDIFTFVEKLENIPFVEALRMLAVKAGISLSDSKQNEKDGRLLLLLEDVTLFYEKELQKSPQALLYIEERGLLEETKKLFRIGFAPNDWRKLFVELSMKGYSPEEMEEAGVVIKALDAHGKVKGWYDRFRGRVMFPIRNIGGRTVGFSGRILPEFIDDTKTQAKYVNTPETVLYHKSKILFGYDTAKKKMAETKEVIVVEGQMDLCMSYQAGVHNTIAVSGTAFTDEHIKLLKRFAEKIILSFDSDQAGIAALKKSAKLCLYGGLDVYAVSLETKDPADLIKENKDLWIDVLSRKEQVILSVLKALSKMEDEREYRRKVKEEVLTLLGAVQSPLDRDYFLTKISEKTGIDKSTLEKETVLDILHTETPKEEVVVKKQVVRKDEVLLTLSALTLWKKYEKRDEFKDILGDMEALPEEIIEKEIFKLSKQTIPDELAEKMFLELLHEYKKERLLANIASVKKELELHQSDDLLEKLHLLMKEKEVLHKK